MLRLGLIGCGEIGEWRARAARAAAGVQLTVACDVAPARAERLGRAYGAAWTADWRDVITNPNVDTVVVSTINDTHHEIGLQALRAGKHLIIEKPLARTPEECRELVECAREHGLQLMTGFNHRRFPSFARAKEMLTEGAIGRLVFVRARIGHPGGAEVEDTWHLNRDVAGGGTLMDNGVHMLDLIRYYAGEVQAVHGVVVSARWAGPATEIEDLAVATFRAVGGVTVALSSSWIEWPGYVIAVELYGTEGYLRAQYPPLKLVYKPRAGRARINWFPIAQIQEKLYSYRWPGIQGFRGDFEELVEAVRDRREPSPSGFDGLRAVEMAYGVYDSARSGREVSLA